MVEEANSVNPINVVRLAELSRNLQGVQLLVEKISFDLESLRAEIDEIKNQNQQNAKLLENVQAFSREFNLLQQQTRKDSLIQEEMKKAKKDIAEKLYYAILELLVRKSDQTNLILELTEWKKISSSSNIKPELNLTSVLCSRT